MAVLDHVCVFCAVEHRQWAFVALCSDVIVRRVDGDSGEVHKQVTNECNSCALNTGVKAITGEKLRGVSNVVHHASI